MFLIGVQKMTTHSHMSKTNNPYHTHNLLLLAAPVDPHDLVADEGVDVYC